MYKYDKEYDRIIKISSNCSAVIKNHKELEVLREALGLKECGEQKYTVQVIAGSDDSFLNISKIDNRIFFESSVETSDTQTCFTQAEIDELKQQPDLAIDWDKAIITPVEEDD